MTEVLGEGDGERRSEREGILIRGKLCRSVRISSERKKNKERARTNSFSTLHVTSPVLSPSPFSFSFALFPAALVCGSTSPTTSSSPSILSNPL